MKTTIILTVFVGLGFFLLLNQAATNNAKREVYAVCNGARLGIDGRSEQACGDLQDRLGIGFLCEANNPLDSNRCWTEAKL